jgi:CBS domain-containing protein
LSKRNKTVNDLVRRGLETIEESESIQEAAAKMRDAKVSSLLVVASGTSGGYTTPKGIVTERDLVRKVCANDIRTSDFKIKDIDSYPLIMIGSEASVPEAIDKMLEKNVRHLLVVNDENKTGNNKPVGIITPLDLVRYGTDDDHSAGEAGNIIETIHHILDYYR